MKKKLTIKDFVPVITWAHAEEKMGKQMYRRFDKWMSGSTCLAGGAYIRDVDRFLKGLSQDD